MSIDLVLIGTNDTVQLDGTNFTLQTGTRGFGIPSPILRIDPSASNGGSFRYSKRDIREIDLPIAITGSDREETETFLRRLANIFRDKVRLQSTYPDGSVWYLDCYYAGGGETVFGSTANDYYCNWDVILRAPQPFWQSTEPFSVSIASSTGTRGLLAGSSPKSLAFLRVKTSQAFGTVTVSNDGDVDAPAIWVVKGPSTLLTIQKSDGTGFTYTTSMSSSDTITIDCEKGTVVDASGVNKYSGLGTAPKLFSLPPGSTTMTITVSGATSDSRVLGYFMPRREVLH